MRNIPLLLNGPMVRAVLEGRKTVTRRIVKQQPTQCSPVLALLPLQRGDWAWQIPGGTGARISNRKDGPEGWSQYSPYGQPGDRLWVRETTRVVEHEPDRRVRVRYEADQSYGVADFPNRLKPVPVGRCVANGCHREAARIFLEVTAVHVERLHDITEDQARAEGVRPAKPIDPRSGEPRDDVQFERPHVVGFAGLWNEINGPGSWDANPWVWVVDFKRIELERKAA